MHDHYLIAHPRFDSPSLSCSRIATHRVGTLSGLTGRWFQEALLMFQLPSVPVGRRIMKHRLDLPVNTITMYKDVQTQLNQGRSVSYLHRIQCCITWIIIVHPCTGMPDQVDRIIMNLGLGNVGNTFGSVQTPSIVPDITPVTSRNNYIKNNDRNSFVAVLRNNDRNNTSINGHIPDSLSAVAPEVDPDIVTTIAPKARNSTIKLRTKRVSLSV